MALKYTNALINSTSPYLLQHAHNPVNWQPWSELIPALATKENKLILVSIGYSACHWCHVMEHESFEDEEVAALMNEYFVCVKVDREERPDVDQYYMTAVQLMQEQGGWPLNVIALPDGRPVWGGTYFPKETWLKNLLAISGFYRENRTKTEEYAANLQTGIQQVLLKTGSDDVIPATEKLVERSIESWKKKFDMENGGMTGRPKFPMPVNLDFLLYYGFIQKDNGVPGFVDITLENMARGGIYDQIGGGFARYSVDEFWKIPHFEKMLYDNGQLLSVYSKGFQLFRNEEYKTVVYETVDFIERSLTDKTGAFYSSLDADSEGEEGQFYVWKPRELKEILQEDFDLFADYFNVNEKGFWELGNFILLRESSDEEFASFHKIEITELQQKISGWKSKLLEAREKRVSPGLDDKTLTSWNALVIQGLTDAYHVFREEYFIQLAEKNAEFLLANVFQTNGKLFHTWKNGKSSVDGFLEDYALFIQACISLFENTGEKKWLDTAIILNNYVFENFYDSQKGLFYFAENKTDSVISNYFQTEDNVIPSSNSVMANNLYSLYLLIGKPEYLVFAKRMLHHVTAQFARYPMAFANWGTLMLKLTHPHFEVVVCGENAKKTIARLQVEYRPDVIWIYSENEKEIPILRSRFKKGKTLIYVCREGVCQLPVENINDAEKLLGSK
jgi:uncharacterized protein